MGNQCDDTGKRHVQAAWTRRDALIAGPAVVATLQAASMGVLGSAPAHAQAEKIPSTATQWMSYGGDKASSKYSPIDQISADNFSRLQVAWTWRSAEEEITKANPDLKTWVWESTPLMVNGVLYVSTSLSQVAAIDAATGNTLWVYDPETWKNGTPSNNGFVHRGVAYWAGGDDQRILFGTGDGYLICLNAQTGKPIPTFGQQGRIDLTQGLGRAVDRRLYGVSSPPIICRDVVVMGSKVHDYPLANEMPPGDVRGFDVRTGKQLWQFRSIPVEGEFGNQTWNEGSWKTTGGANVWTLISADDELGYVYLPFGTPSNDYFGGRRPGDGLFGESSGLPGCAYRQAHLALPDGPPRSMGLRSTCRAQPHRHPGGREAGQGRCAGYEAGFLLRPRPCDRRTDLADRRAARSAVNDAR